MPKVLLVEDDLFLLRMYEKKFEIEGFTVEVAHDGNEGIVKAEAFRPDVILMDIMMPKLTGLQALQRLKENTQLQSIPVLVLTNLSNTDDAAAASKAGAAGYLVKSDLTPGQVVEQVRNLLGIPK